MINLIMDIQLSKIAEDFLKEVDAFYSYAYEEWLYYEDGIYVRLKQEGDKLVNISTGEVIG